MSVHVFVWNYSKSLIFRTSWSAHTTPLRKIIRTLNENTTMLGFWKKSQWNAFIGWSQRSPHCMVLTRPFEAFSFDFMRTLDASPVLMMLHECSWCSMSAHEAPQEFMIHQYASQVFMMRGECSMLLSECPRCIMLSLLAATKIPALHHQHSWCTWVRGALFTSIARDVSSRLMLQNDDQG